MVIKVVKSLEVLGEQIRIARGSRSQAYVAARLDRSKAWMSKIENGQIRIAREQLRQFARLVQWSETKLQEALALLGERPFVSMERPELLRTVEQNLTEIGKLTNSPKTASLLIAVLQDMDPFPTLPFLQFMADVTAQALLRARESG